MKQQLNYVKRLLNSVNNNLFNLSKLEVNDLCQFNGIGEAKAVSIIAAFGNRKEKTEHRSGGKAYIK
ncbi:hypothetical protein [Sphingobacterium daejeonense]|uniref:hypothetical protein n=1 Tax=Sphingobacterium daejeonense TaxID=371142 RepID=UPI0010C4C912|nr:hypothetical protein [Sphingobacterium daejeonense]VTQ02610.1 Uncharacterised protein [Sphingobacterium daejeonense]